MLTRSLMTSVLPTERRRLRLWSPAVRVMIRRLWVVRRRSLLVQDRVDAARARCVERHMHGRRDA
jgi:hypothetical protein